MGQTHETPWFLKIKNRAISENLCKTVHKLSNGLHSPETVLAYRLTGSEADHLTQERFTSDKMSRQLVA
jgi:hypothetical protein